MHIDDIRLEIEICGFCPLMCKDICCFHGNARTEDSAPHIRNLYLWRVMEAADLGEKKERLKDATGIIYQCTLCGQCTAWCARSRDIPTNMMAGRADVVEQGLAPRIVAEMDERTGREHNPYGEPHGERMNRLDTGLREALAGKNEGSVGLWLGCTTLYHQPEMAQALARVMDAAGVAYQVLGEEEWCCGLPLYKLGLRKRAEELAEHNLQAMKKRGLRTLVVDCPECYRAFKEFYPAMGRPFGGKIMHSSQFIRDLIAQEKIVPRKTVDRVLAYHDPCELARHSTPDVRTRYDTSDLFDPPREILRSIPGVTLKEMRWEKEKTFCCGGPVGVREMYPRVSDEIARKVPREAEKVGAGTLAVACPACKRQFVCAVQGQGSLEVISIAELVAGSL
jgi:heterodisulfide reductase subunit D